MSYKIGFIFIQKKNWKLNFKKIMKIEVKKSEFHLHDLQNICYTLTKQELKEL